MEQNHDWGTLVPKPQDISAKPLKTLLWESRNKRALDANMIWEDFFTAPR